jgi:hypothetical protein
MKDGKFWPYWAISCLILGACLTIYFLTREQHVFLRIPQWGTIESTSAPFLKTIQGRPCLIRFTSIDGLTHHITFHQDFFKSPLFVISSPRPGEFFCVYDNDVNYHLIQIDVNKPFHRFTPQSPIGHLILESSCEIERVTKDDTNSWNLVADALEKMTSSEYKRSEICPGFLIRSDKEQLVRSIHNFGDSGVYPGEVVNLQHEPQKISPK